MSQMQVFFHTLNTISKKVLFDFNKYKKKKITKKQFCEKLAIRPQVILLNLRAYEAFDEYFISNKIYKNLKIKE